MKHKDIIVAIIAFLVLFVLMSCERQEPIEQEQPPKIKIEEEIQTKEEIKEDIKEEKTKEEVEEDTEEEDTNVPIDYDVEDEVLPEGY